MWNGPTGMTKIHTGRRFFREIHLFVLIFFNFDSLPILRLIKLVKSK